MPLQDKKQEDWVEVIEDRVISSWYLLLSTRLSFIRPRTHRLNHHAWEYFRDSRSSIILDVSWSRHFIAGVFAWRFWVRPFAVEVELL